MTDVRIRLADALREHRYLKTIHDGGEPQECCTCPWTGPCHEAHQSDILLSLPGIAIVEGALEKETHWGPISVPEYHDDGSPVMDERLAQPVHKHHFEWVTRRRLVGPWVEVGERESSEDLAGRLAANAAEADQ